MVVTTFLVEKVENDNALTPLSHTSLMLSDHIVHFDKTNLSSRQWLLEGFAFSPLKGRIVEDVLSYLDHFKGILEATLSNIPAHWAIPEGTFAP